SCDAELGDQNAAVPPPAAPKMKDTADKRAGEGTELMASAGAKVHLGCGAERLVAQGVCRPRGVTGIDASVVTGHRLRCPELGLDCPRFVALNSVSPSGEPSFS